MLSTPDYGKLHDSVYEPAEDTFILLDALEEDSEELRGLKPSVCLEIGSGSGVVSTFLSKIIGGNESLYLTTDLNPHATLATQHTSSLNDSSLQPIRTNLLDGLTQRIRRNPGSSNGKESFGTLDVVVFNPPYVVTEEEEMSTTQQEGNIGATWAGGLNGMRITDLVLNMIPDLLAKNGRFYLVAINSNKPEAIMKMMTARGLGSSIVLKRRAGRELLFVLRFIKL